jgi:hypothetical protein
MRESGPIIGFSPQADLAGHRFYFLEARSPPGSPTAILSARHHRADKVRPDGVRAAHHRAIAAIDNGLRLIKDHYALDAGDQQARQIL